MTQKEMSPKRRYATRLVKLSENDEQIGRLIPDVSIREKALVEGLSYDKVIGVFLDGYPNRPALGERAYEIVADEEGLSAKKYLPAFSTITYDKFHDRIKQLAMAWRTHEHCLVSRSDFVLIMGFADIDFSTIDFACTYAKAITVPVQSSSSGADLIEIVDNIKPVVIASTIEDLELAAKLAIHQDNVHSIIVFNYDEQVDVDRAKVEKVKQELEAFGDKKQLFTLAELLGQGKHNAFTYLPDEENELTKPTAIIHSSGSTGKPKGAVISQDAFIHRWIGREVKLPRVTVLLAPLNHIMGRINLMSILSIGGTGYFTLMPDMSTMLEDVRLARPTFLSLFPRIFELIHQHYQNEVANLSRNSASSKEEIEQQVMQDLRSSYLGDRLLCIVYGSAPTSPAVQQFMEECFEVLMVEGYGNTESGTGGLTLDGKITRETVLEYKLRDVPELGYFTTDKPFPRGEFLVKTKYGIKEYYNQPETTAKLFSEDGYSCTGDIVELIGHDEIRVIDRVKDVLKLSHGEYVATGTLGTIYEAGSAIIKQIYVYGNSNRSYLLAVVVPESDLVKQQLGTNPTEAQIKNLIRDELNHVAKTEDLRNFEVPRDYIIEHEEFTQENGLLSSVRKRLRPALKRKYGSSLEGLYEAHEQSADERVIALKDPNSPLSTVEKLVVLLESQLNIEGVDHALPRNFSELGGDSIGASLFSLSIEETFDVNLAADVILSPTGNLRIWASYIDEVANTNVTQQASFSSIHGKGATTVYPKDIKLEHFITADILENANDLPYIDTEPTTVLLTGANGFLGHIVCLEWLKILARRGGKLICLIREKSNEAAYEKLAKEFNGLDSEMEDTFHSLATNHLEVLAADITRPLLGLSYEVHQKLAIDVDWICHVAALVNHRLSYKDLFGPNVGGTAEIIRLALTERRKPIDFISTVGVFMLLDSANGINESTPFKKAINLTDGYANGYAASKWGGELLLRETNKRFKIPMNIFRCDMIMPDQFYKGQANTADMLTRILVSVALTGLAPQSFYQESGRRDAHYVGVPVDALAKAICGVHTTAHDSCKTYHSINYNTDNVSLDSFVDWIESAGYPMHRFDDHKEWYKRLETKLKAMPEEIRRQSALDVLIAYKRQGRGGQNKIGTANFKQLIKELSTLSGLPSLSESYIHKYLNDLQILGLLSPQTAKIETELV